MSEAVARRRRRLAVRLMLAAFAWSAGLILAALFLPSYDGQTDSSSSGLTLTRSTFVAVNGARGLIVVAVPVVVCVLVAACLYSGRQRWLAWVALGLLSALCLLAILSVGVFMAPVAVLLAVALKLIAPASRARPVRG